MSFLHRDGTVDVERYESGRRSEREGFIRDLLRDRTGLDWGQVLCATYEPWYASYRDGSNGNTVLHLIAIHAVAPVDSVHLREFLRRLVYDEVDTGATNIDNKTAFDLAPWLKQKMSSLPRAPRLNPQLTPSNQYRQRVRGCTPPDWESQCYDSDDIVGLRELGIGRPPGYSLRSNPSIRLPDVRYITNERIAHHLTNRNLRVAQFLAQFNCGNLSVSASQASDIIRFTKSEKLLRLVSPAVVRHWERDHCRSAVYDSMLFSSTFDGNKISKLIQEYKAYPVWPGMVELAQNKFGKGELFRQYESEFEVDLNQVFEDRNYTLAQYLVVDKGRAIPNQRLKEFNLSRIVRYKYEDVYELIKRFFEAGVRITGPVTIHEKQTTLRTYQLLVKYGTPVQPDFRLYDEHRDIYDYLRGLGFIDFDYEIRKKSDWKTELILDFDNTFESRFDDLMKRLGPPLPTEIAHIVEEALRGEHLDILDFLLTYLTNPMIDGNNSILDMFLSRWDRFDGVSLQEKLNFLKRVLAEKGFTVRRNDTSIPKVPEVVMLLLQHGVHVPMSDFRFHQPLAYRVQLSRTMVALMSSASRTGARSMLAGMDPDILRRVFEMLRT